MKHLTRQPKKKKAKKEARSNMSNLPVLSFQSPSTKPTRVPAATGTNTKAAS